MPYVYDHFRWPHCAAEGYPIDLVWDGPVGDDDSGRWDALDQFD